MNQETRQQVAQAVKAIESKKAEDVAILEMDKASGAFTDCFVVCSGTNPRQIQTIAEEVERQLALDGRRPSSVEGYNQAEWVLLDYLDFVVHIFSERARKFYDLERLWRSARRLRPADLVKKPAIAKTRAKAAPQARAGAGKRKALSKSKTKGRVRRSRKAS